MERRKIDELSDGKKPASPLARLPFEKKDSTQKRIRSIKRERGLIRMRKSLVDSEGTILSRKKRVQV